MVAVNNDFATNLSKFRAVKSFINQRHPKRNKPSSLQTYRMEDYIMAVVSDFVHIVGDDNIRIGDGSHENGFTRSFNTGARLANYPAYISFMVKGMTATDDDADVFVNDKKVGVLFKAKDGNPNHWQTQTVWMDGSDLKDGDNVLRVGTVSNPTGTDTFDDFTIRSVYCHFHQNS